MKNKELKEIIQTAAIKQDIKGVMELTDCTLLSYERVSRVWRGDTSAKLSDVSAVANVLGLKIKFVSNPEVL